MDTSNPIVPNDRRSIKDLMETQRMRRKQDLRYLRDLTQNADRYVLPVEAPILSDFEAQRMVEQYKLLIPEVSVAREEPVPDVLEVLFEDIPVCGLLDTDGLPLHPPDTNNNLGKLSVVRVMGGVPPPPVGVKQAVEVLGEKVLNVKQVYTGGQWDGFMKRIQDQMGRRTVSYFKSYEMVHKRLPSVKLVKSKLDQLFPRTAPSKEWPRLDEDLDLHMENIKITGSSSAGAPYWRNKAECIDSVMQTGLPVLLQHLKSNTLDKLWKENPEMFICEVKNKMDRYDISKLSDKTRPYCCVPAHWAFLFSVLTQRFQDGLGVFDKVGGVNAYGFSAPNGGLERFVDWMYSASKDGQYVVYGDDTCLVKKDKQGKVWRVDPDFKQMDGSLNRDDVSLVCDWVVDTLLKEDGLESEGEFWRVVAEEWFQMAVNPVMVLHGKTVYKKKNPDGMMSGVPGTTLFDTVKSALSWDLYLEFCALHGRDPMDGALCTQFMDRVCGLVIKEGTFAPVQLPSRHTLSPGDLVSDHKFLGVQILVEEYRGKQVFVPTIPLEDAVSMIMVQKDNPFDVRSSPLSNNRKLYDRCRGLMITFGFGIPLIRDALHHIVNGIDPIAIVMCANLGTGEKPEHIMLEDYAYPDSSGFPTREYCLSLYSSEGRNEELWIPLFPSLEKTLERLRGETRVIHRIVRHEQGEGGVKKVVATFDEGPGEQPPAHPEMAVLAVKNKIQPAKKTKDNAPHPRSQIVDADGKKEKYLPDMITCIRELLNIYGTLQIQHVMQHLGCSARSVVRAIEEGGVYATGVAVDSLLSLYPIETAAATEQSDFYETNLNNRVVDKHIKDRLVQASRSGMDTYVATSPPVVRIDDAFLADFRDLDDPESFDVLADALNQLPIQIVKHTPASCVRWTNSKVYPREENPVEVMLEVEVGGRWVPVAEGRSVNKQSAKQHIAAIIFETVYKRLAEDQFSCVRPADAHDMDMDWALEVEKDAKPQAPAVEVGVVDVDWRVFEFKLADELLKLGGDARYMVGALKGAHGMFHLGISKDLIMGYAIDWFLRASAGSHTGLFNERPIPNVEVGDYYYNKDLGMAMPVFPPPYAAEQPEDTLPYNEVIETEEPVAPESTIKRTPPGTKKTARGMACSPKGKVEVVIVDKVKNTTSTKQVHLQGNEDWTKALKEPNTKRNAKVNAKKKATPEKRHKENVRTRERKKRQLNRLRAQQ